jgi:hypothetical protein
MHVGGVQKPATLTFYHATTKKGAAELVKPTTKIKLDKNGWTSGDFNINDRTAFYLTCDLAQAKDWPRIDEARGIVKYVVDTDEFLALDGIIFNFEKPWAFYDDTYRGQFSDLISFIESADSDNEEEVKAIISTNVIEWEQLVEDGRSRTMRDEYLKYDYIEGPMNGSTGSKKKNPTGHQLALTSPSAVNLFNTATKSLV